MSMLLYAQAGSYMENKYVRRSRLQDSQGIGGSPACRSNTRTLCMGDPHEIPRDRTLRLQLQTEQRSPIGGLG